MCLRNTTPPNPPQLVDDLILEAGCITDCLDLPALAYAAAAGAVDGGVAESGKEAWVVSRAPHDRASAQDIRVGFEFFGISPATILSLTLSSAGV